MNICIRVDGGSIIGMGHVMRCLALAKELSKKYSVFFACRVDEPLTNKYSPGIELIKKNGFDVKEINENLLKEEIKSIIADCIITDSYDVDEKYFDMIKKYFKISGYIDDNNICEYFNVDFLINQNIYAKEIDYKVKNNTKLLLGSKFLILRDEFRIKNKKKIINKKLENIMITVGGSDNSNLTELLIRQLLHTEYKLHVVIGNGFNNIDILKKYESSKIKLYFNANMKDLMDKVDVCISGCGSTVYELAVSGVPSIGILVADNQKRIAKHMSEKRLIIFCKKDIVLKSLGEMNYDVRKELSNRCAKVIDKNGAFRICKKISSLIDLNKNLK